MESKSLLHLFGKWSFLDLENGSYQGNVQQWFGLCVINFYHVILRIRRYSSMFGFLWQVHQWILNGVKKMSALIWIRVYKQDLTCITLTPQGLFRYSKMMGSSLSVSRRYLVKLMVSDAHVHQTKNLFPKLGQTL